MDRRYDVLLEFRVLGAICADIAVIGLSLLFAFLGMYTRHGHSIFFNVSIASQAPPSCSSRAQWSHGCFQPRSAGPSFFARYINYHC
jgi:hypothetical protein